MSAKGEYPAQHENRDPGAADGMGRPFQGGPFSLPPQMLSPYNRGSPMFFMLADALDIDWASVANWFNIAIWVFVAWIIGLPLLRAFLKGLVAPPGQNDIRPSANGRSSNLHLPAPFRIKNAYVIDGDTLARGDWRIRIYGMDAPESNQPGGTEATARMRELVAGKTLQILPVDVDIYGRLVARVRAGSYDIGAEMVKSGHAVATSDFTKVYTKFEKEARRSRKGLWKQGAIQDPKLWRDAGK